MFTGLIETVGRVRKVVSGKGATRLTVATDLPLGSMADGESVAVDGVCLTVSRRAKGAFEADAVAETLKRTTLGELRPGDTVHLERSLAVGDRLGGHLVQGHVDAVARVIGSKRSGQDVRLTVALPPAIRGLVAKKGSIALHGVSLTVSGLTASRFEVALIPETVARTRLGSVRAGDRLNVEADLIARYLDALMRARRR
jgi:riboflavin synthase